ncbi:MAG: J domain-containing protein [Dyella sp.]|uniref:J domain-containing protein n=1 Tax=Dyella sp. TaxID=1869338 RepID=UPI003F7EFFFC
MSTTIPAFPLQWPAGWKRTPLSSRTRARFSQSNSDLTVAQATRRVIGELRRMGVHDYDLIISSNLELRLDGLPRSGQRDPEDPGVAVYWRDNTQDGWPMRCMAVDRYDRVADNLAAVAATLDAMRAIERHGGAEVLNRAFTGFTALPGAGGTEHWSDVLGVDERATREEIDAAYRRLRSLHHPDRGGDADEFHRITKAYEEACSA